MKRKLLNFSKYTLSIMLIGIVLMGSGCEKDTPPDCGCESVTVRIIPESANLVGNMYYKTQSSDPMDTYYNNYFWIVYTDKSCINCVHSMIVCNEEIMNNQFESIKGTGEIVEVKFSGHVKEICEKTFAPADYTYERIVITSIERLKL